MRKRRKEGRKLTKKKEGGEGIKERGGWKIINRNKSI